jgi:MFS family permease
MNNLLLKNNKAALPAAYPAYLPWLIWCIAALFYFYEFFLQVSPNVMVPELMSSFHVTAASLGNLAAFYFYAYAIMQIPAGVLLDFFGPRRLLTFAAATCMFGCVLFGSTTHLDIAELARFLIGLGSSFAFIGCLKLATQWFPQERFALICGITITIGMLGAVGGEAPLALLVDTIGWRASIIIFGLLGALLSISFWFLIEKSPPYVDPESLRHIKPFNGLGGVLSNKQTWLTAIYCGLMFAPTSIFGALWGTPFLMQAYNISRPIAAGIVSLMFIGWAIGAPLGGWISSVTKKKRPVAIAGSIGLLITLLLVIYVHVPISSLYLLLFAIGFFSSGFIPAFSIAREVNPPAASATALGFMNMVNTIGGALGQPFIGWLLDLSWNGQVQAGIHVYSTQSFHTAFIMLPIFIALSLFMLCFIREPICHHSYTNNP